MVDPVHYLKRSPSPHPSWSEQEFRRHIRRPCALYIWAPLQCASPGLSLNYFPLDDQPEPERLEPRPPSFAVAHRLCAILTAVASMTLVGGQR
ncbi:uncharacterized protein B0T23DRAFT_370954 [Neurospora hispaniola]|uniref:Uncharacterized protein n=1 Tax=Neurospora hispaniola TaxID=588809 RepID=A0AAJ0IGI7_9PEZI|nr:hypothetical protein B0T23DRAFT_370954 [Neurospora hispaniola]